MSTRTAYRYPEEHLILAVTLLLVLVVIAVSATATLCGSLVFLLIAVVMAYLSTRSHHQALMTNAHPVTAQTLPGLHRVTEQSVERLQPGPVAVYVANSRELNAYTFGLDTPKIVVLYSSLLQLMDEGEIRFILGHELGHVALGHTWLNSLVGGLAGTPSGSAASAILTLAFLRWNRACEFSADRAGLLACGDLNQAISALVKLVAGPSGLTRTGLEQAYRQIDAEDDDLRGMLSEALGTHPMLIRRIQELRRWAASEEYRRLQSLPHL